MVFSQLCLAPPCVCASHPPPSTIDPGGPEKAPLMLEFCQPRSHTNVKYIHATCKTDQCKNKRRSDVLTFDCTDDTVAIFDQLFEKFTCSVQLHFITLESLPEVRTVQIAVAEFQRRVTHGADGLTSHTGGGETQKTHTHAAWAWLGLSAHFCSVTPLHVRLHSHLLRIVQTVLSVGACGQLLSHNEATRTAKSQFINSLPPFTPLTRTLMSFGRILLLFATFSLLRRRD